MGLTNDSSLWTNTNTLKYVTRYFNLRIRVDAQPCVWNDVIQNYNLKRDFSQENQHRTGLFNQVYPDMLLTLASREVAFQIYPPANQRRPGVLTYARRRIRT